MTNWQNRIKRLEYLPANQLLANPLNARRHPAKQRDALRGSLDSLGWYDAVIYNQRTGYLVDGHARVEEQLTKDDSATIPVLVVDLSEEEEAQALASHDWIAHLAEYDKQVLDDLLRTFNSDDERVQTMLSEMADEFNLFELQEIEEAPEAKIDEAEALREKWQTERGQLWVIPSKHGGEHRLLCGDCSIEEDVDRLIDNLEIPLMITDPPYGVKMSKGFSGSDGFGGSGKPIARRTYNDTWDEERPSKITFDLLLSKVNLAIIFGGNYFADLLPQSTHWIVWDKLQTMPTFGDCELAWTNIGRKSVKKFTVQYNGLIGKEEERYHPTQKPVKLLIEIINHYESQIVFDPFGGSGATMVACEQLHRQCRMIEIEPKYVATILERMSNMGLTPVLME